MVPPSYRLVYNPINYYRYIYPDSPSEIGVIPSVDSWFQPIICRSALRAAAARSGFQCRAGPGPSVEIVKTISYTII